MGRGKKKDKKNENKESTSILDTGASTSQDVVVPHEIPSTSTTASTTSEAPTVPTSSSSAVVTPADNPDEGLGLFGPSKKSKPRKKKPVPQQDVPKETQQQVGPFGAPQATQKPGPWKIPLTEEGTVTPPLPAHLQSQLMPSPNIDISTLHVSKSSSAGFGQEPSTPRPGPFTKTSAAMQKPSQLFPTPTATPAPAPAPAQTPAAQHARRSSATSTGSTSSSTSGASSLCRYQVPPKFPSKGGPLAPRSQRITIITNYLPMKVQSKLIYRYDIAFKPDRPKKFIPLAYAEFEKRHFPKHVIAFDQMKNCYTFTPLPKVPKDERLSSEEEVVDSNGKVMKFEVSIKATGVVDLSILQAYMDRGSSLCPPTEAIQCVDVILRQGTLQSYVKVGRQFFKRPLKPVDLGKGLEMWTGLFQSAIFTSSPYINIDVAHKGFPRSQTLISSYVNDFELDIKDPPKLNEYSNSFFTAFQTFIKGLRVLAVVGGDASAKGQKREFICNGLVDAPSRMRFSFTDQGKTKEITVADYFIQEKKIRLQYPNLYCVWVGPKEKKIYYPMELLSIVHGQVLNKQLNERQLSNMVREAATAPDIRKQKIEEVISNMKYSQNPYFRQFGLEISTDFLKVEAKVLQPPQLEIGGRSALCPRRGQWQANTVYKAQPLESWQVIVVDECITLSDVDDIIGFVSSVARELGMSVSKPLAPKSIRLDALQRTLLDALDKAVKFLFIVIPSRGDNYHRVKRMAERDVGILTQCIKDQTAKRRMNSQTARNILLKVNSKLMGINQVLHVQCLPACIRDGGVMVVGADVTHPSPDQTSVPSIAAVTASLDPKCSQYNIGLSIQTPKKEVIVDFEEMMLEHLQLYFQFQRAYPKKIYVFRDGVSEGQFAQVMNSELQGVYNAYRRMTNSNAKPEILFMLVQKRHHTRFFLDNRNPQNVDPGTVVDTKIVHAHELDFYLVSHAAVKGTSRPTRYHAVCNDGRIPHDEVEQLTYYLCHLYARCMRAVSYPTPTYYAHLACLRARSLTYGEKFDNSELERKPKRLRVLERMLRMSPMFFV